MSPNELQGADRTGAADVTLAITYHDPDGRLYQQVRRILPLLQQLFAGIVVVASAEAYGPTQTLLAGAGAVIQKDTTDPAVPISRRLGRSRRDLLALALTQNAPFLLAADGDRIFHWAEFHPEELARVLQQLTEYDLTVVGRSARAFVSHPRMQCDTETIVNKMFATIFGQSWDIAAATRGLSRRGAATIVASCDDDSLGVDASWPLFLQQRGGFSLAYLATEGMEFETADRFPQEVAAAGGLDAWMAQLDTQPRLWQQRLEFARVEIKAMIPYWEMGE